MKTLSDNYPERLRRFIIYPFPWFGRALYSIAKLFLDSRTQEKIVLIAGADNSPELPDELLNYVDTDNLPVCFGGKYTNPPIDIKGTIQTDVS